MKSPAVRMLPGRKAGDFIPAGNESSGCAGIKPISLALRMPRGSHTKVPEGHIQLCSAASLTPRCLQRGCWLYEMMDNREISDFVSESYREDQKK